jgi:hypothetical protein
MAAKAGCAVRKLLPCLTFLSVVNWPSPQDGALLTELAVHAAIFLDFSTRVRVVRGAVAVYNGCFTFKTTEVTHENSSHQTTLRLGLP